MKVRSNRHGRAICMAGGLWGSDVMLHLYGMKNLTLLRHRRWRPTRLHRRLPAKVHMWRAGVLRHHGANQRDRQQAMQLLRQHEDRAGFHGRHAGAAVIGSDEDVVWVQSSKSLLVLSSLSSACRSCVITESLMSMLALHG